MKKTSTHFFSEKLIELWNRPGWLLVIAVLSFTLMAACVKVLSNEIGLYQISFFRTLVTTLIVGLLMLRQKVSFKANNLPILLLRSCAGFIAMSAHFYTLGNLSFGDTSVLVNTAPIFIVIMSVLYLKERPPHRIWGFVLLSWLGIFLVLRPQMDFFNWAGLIALIAGFFTAVVVIVIRQSHESDDTLRIAFYFMALSTFMAIPLMWSQWSIPSSRQILFLISSGFFGTVGQVFMTRAYGLDHVSRLSHLGYVGVVFSFILGIIFWHEIPTLSALLGSLIVIGSCILISRIKVFKK